MNTPSRGPGFRRMMDRAGQEQAERLRQQVLREQEGALAEARKTRPTAEREQVDPDYPQPARPARRRKPTLTQK